MEAMLARRSVSVIMSSFVTSFFPFGSAIMNQLLRKPSEKNLQGSESTRTEEEQKTYPKGTELS
jgi:hypothetical protein